MTTEPVHLVTRDHRRSPATALVTRRSIGARLARAAPVALLGAVLGVASLPIPAAHLVLPWLLPLLGLGIAAYLASVHTIIGDVSGTCPMCAGAITVTGGPLEDPMWLRCSACQAPLKLELAPPSASSP